jgi:hypothetical protein
MGILFASKSRANNELYRRHLDIGNSEAIDESFPRVRTSFPSCGKRLSISSVYDGASLDRKKFQIQNATTPLSST